MPKLSSHLSFDLGLVASGSGRLIQLALLPLVYCGNFSASFYFLVFGGLMPTAFCVPCYHVGFLHPNLRGLGKFISGHGKSSCPFPHVGMEWNSNILPMNVKLLITCPGTKREVPVPLSWPIPGEFSVARRKDNHCPKERGG